LANDLGDEGIHVLPIKNPSKKSWKVYDPHYPGYGFYYNHHVKFGAIWLQYGPAYFQLKSNVLPLLDRSIEGNGRKYEEKYPPVMDEDPQNIPLPALFKKWEAIEPNDLTLGRSDRVLAVGAVPTSES